MARREPGGIIGGGTVVFRDNSKEILAALDNATAKILSTIGLKAEGYAKSLCPAGTVESAGAMGRRGGTLRKSITHNVEDGQLSVGSDVEYASFVELGTGSYFEPPPEWERFETDRGSDVGHAYVKPRPYLRPAIEDHADEYRRIAQSGLKG